MWQDVALRGVHLRLPWLHVAWHRLASLHVGSPLGSQNSLAPLIFEVCLPGHSGTAAIAEREQLRTGSLRDNRTDWAARRLGRDVLDVAPRQGHA